MISKRTSVMAALLAGGLVGLLALSPGVSQEGTPPAGDTQSMADTMAAWTKANTLGPQHEQFKEMIGTWKVVSKIWMMPGMPPMVSEGTVEFELMLGGRFVRQEFNCAMMGGKYHGIGIEGYDTIKKKYVSIWMDDMCTGIGMMEGTIDATGKVITYFGTMNDPLTGELDKMTKAVLREVSKDECIFTMYEFTEGVGEVKKMEMTYTR